MKILYFAWIKTKAGVAQEEVTLPGEVSDVAGLIDWLRTRGQGFEAAFEDLTVVRVAVNEEYAGLDQPVTESDEVAFFPPVTGG